MTAYKYFHIIVIAICLSFPAIGQNAAENVPTAKLKGYAKNSLMMGDSYSAIDYLGAYMAKHPKDDEAAYLLAESYRLARNYREAEDWYKKAYDLNHEKNAEALFYYALMLKTDQKYDDALTYFNKFKKEYTGNDENNLKKLLRDQIASCENAKHLMDSVVVVEVKAVDKTINKPSVELSPMFLDDNKFVFASLRSDSALSIRIDRPDEKAPVRKFYTAKRLGDKFVYTGEWRDNDFSSPDVNSGNGALSPDKKRFYFTRCEKNWKYQTLCKIYMSELRSNRWQKSVELPKIINDPDYTTTQPAVGVDSKSQNEVLYFVSDRKGGKGGLDIWYSIYDAKKKEWKEPKNCGGKINSTGNEMTPYSDNENKTLYFSSDGLPGLGGYDIFKAIGEESRFLMPTNLGYPINSSYDDLYYTLNNRKKEEGLLVSNRPHDTQAKTETCCDDIFSFIYNQPIRVAATGKVFAIEDEEINKILDEKFTSSTPDKNAVKDTTSEKPVEGSIVSLYMVDKATNDVIYIKNDTTDAMGKYFFTLEPYKDYVLQFENYGNFDKKVKFTTKKVTKSDTIHINNVGVNLIPKKPLIIKNIYYDFDKSDLKPVAKRTLDSTVLVLMKNFPQIVVEISSHTDGKGDEEYNKKLSQKRAESVVNYLISKGIKPNRLYAKGYGKERPIAPNENPDGTDNPDGREKNRRTEFKIIGSLSQYSEIIYQQ